MQTASHALSWYLVPYFYKDCTPQSVKDNRMFIMTVTGNSSPNNRELEVPNMPTSSVCDGIMTTRTTNILRQATRPAAMDFSGTWKVYSEENLEDFLKVIGRNVFYLFRDYFPMYAYIMIFFFLICLQGAPEMVIKMRKEVKPVMVIEQNGKDFTCTTKTPSSTHVSSFSIGKESEITIMDGRKVKVIQASRYLESVRLILLLSSLSTYIFICTLICYWLLKKKIGFLLS